MPDEDLGELWSHASAVLPLGWHLDTLLCASTSLAPEDHSNEWIAVAAGPDGAERRLRGATPREAIDQLAAAVGRS